MSIKKYSYQSSLIIKEKLGRGFICGYDNQRRKNVLTNNGQPVYTRYYFGKYEVEVTPIGTKQICYIPGPAGNIAVHITENGTSNYYFTITDYLGSILAIADESGNIVEEQSFDAWGRNRNPNTWEYDNAQRISLLFRGYTGHEMLPEFGLINMNGRMYDPLVSRMLSPDNFIQSPDFSQSFNRYSYAWNNPLKFTDPSGEIVWMPIIMGAAFGGFSGWQIGQAAGAEGWEMAGYILGGALIGGVSGGIGTAVSSSVAGATGIIGGGVVGGAAGGAGFGIMGGYAAGLRGTDLIGAGFTGLWTGIITGGMGSAVGGAIGGGWGALAGGATSNLTGQLLSNRFSFKDINWASVALSGGTSLGIYHASLAYSYHASGIKSTGLNYNQYARMMRTTQRSMFQDREGKFIPNTRGGITVNKLGEAYRVISMASDYIDALFGYHTHTEFGQDGFSTFQHAIDASRPLYRSDQWARGTLSQFAHQKHIPKLTMYLGTREGNIHYWTHYLVQGTLNYNFSHVFTPFNFLWSLSLIR